jgi:hypothetical protein
MFYYQLSQDHSRTDLIWNHRTREELREGLESEMRAFNIDKELGGTQALEVSWNYVEFEVKYESLSEELKIGDNYVRLLLEQGSLPLSLSPLFLGCISSISCTLTIFRSLFQALLTTSPIQMAFSLICTTDSC